jgi:hypothetical protein
MHITFHILLPVATAVICLPPLLTCTPPTVLARRWASTLRELRLGLSRSDFTHDGLRALRHFTRLRALSIIVESAPAAVGGAASADAVWAGVPSSMGADGGQAGLHPPAGTSNGVPSTSGMTGTVLSSSPVLGGLPAPASLPTPVGHAATSARTPAQGLPHGNSSAPITIPRVPDSGNASRAHAGSLPQTLPPSSPTLPWHSGPPLPSSMSLGLPPVAPAAHGLSTARSASPSLLSRSPAGGAGGPGVTALPPDVVVIDLRTLPDQLEELELCGVVLQVQGPVPFPAGLSLRTQQGWVRHDVH